MPVTEKTPARLARVSATSSQAETRFHRETSPPTPDQLATLTAQFEAGTWLVAPEPSSATEAEDTIRAGEYRERIRRVAA